MPSRLRAVIALGLGAVALAACSPQAAGPTSVPTSVAPVNEPTPGETFVTPTPPATATTPPPVPQELTEHSEAGSRAAIEYYVALYGYAKQTGDTDEFRASFAKSCKGCILAADDVDAANSVGNTIEGDVPTVNKTALLAEQSTSDRHVWYVAISTTGLVLRDPLGAVISKREGTASDSALVAEWADERWVVTDVARVIFDD